MAAKVCDGLFIGDADSACDLEFLSMNKIAHLVNTAGQETGNRFASHGFVYLTRGWEDHEAFDLGSGGPSSSSSSGGIEAEARCIADFIEAAISEGISVLVYSLRGRGRSAAALCMYLMVRFCWGYDKALAFLRSRKPDVAVNSGFAQQLTSLERRLMVRRVQQEGDGRFDLRRVKDWDVAVCLADSATDRELLGDEILLVTFSLPPFTSTDALTAATPSQQINSFTNSATTFSRGHLPGPYRSALDAPKSFRVRFSLHATLLEPQRRGRARPVAESLSKPPLSAMKGSRQKMPGEGRKLLDGQRAERASSRQLGSRIDEDEDPDDGAGGGGGRRPDPMTRDDLSDISDPASPALDSDSRAEAADPNCGYDDDSVSALLNSVDLRSRDNATVGSSASSRVSDLYNFVGLETQAKNSRAGVPIFNSTSSLSFGASSRRDIETIRVAGAKTTRAQAVKYAYPTQLLVEK